MHRILLLCTVLTALIISGCADDVMGPQDAAPDRQDESVRTETGLQTKFRHPQLLSRSRSSRVSGKDDNVHLFVAFNGYEADGVTRRVLDEWGVTRRILEEYGITRRVLESYGVTRRILQEYGVTRRVLDAYGITRRVLESYGVTPGDLDGLSGEITDAFLSPFNVSEAVLEGQGVTRRVLDDYGITRRVLDDYGVTETELAEAIADFHNPFGLRVRFTQPYPGISVRLPEDLVEIFLEEVADDEEVLFLEPDLSVDFEDLGRVSNDNAGQSITWNVDRVGTPLTDYTYGDVDIYLLDSGVFDFDLTIVEKKDFTMLFVDREEATWDEDDAVPVEMFDPGTAGDWIDRSGHGTHVAGIIGAEDNSIGVLGVAPHAKIHSFKVLTEEGQTDVTTVVSALALITNRKLENPDDEIVINMSFGMDIESTEHNMLDDAVQTAIDAGIVVVVSAGNDSKDAETYSPAHVADAITVGAYDENDEFADFSNEGSFIDLLAPGEHIASLSNDPEETQAGLLAVQSGTSMATPHVTGAAAHYMSLNPGRTPAQVLDGLLQYAQAGIAETPSGTTDKGVYIGEFARDTDQDYDLYLSKATWESATQELLVDGKSHQWEEVVLRSAGSGTELARPTTNDLGLFSISIDSPAIVPCEVVASFGQEVYTKSVLHAPDDCDKTFALTDADWVAAESHVRIEGQGPAGAEIEFLSVETGVNFASLTIDATGFFTTNVSYPAASWHEVPCLIRGVFGSLQSETVVDSKPSVCDFGVLIPNEPFVVSFSKWESSTGEFLARGKGAKEASVEVMSQGSGTVLGSTTVYYDAEWEFRTTDPALVPCAVAAISQGANASRSVDAHPADCDKAFTFDYSTWQGSYDRLRLKGEGPAGTEVTFSSIETGEEFFSATVGDDGFYENFVDFAEGSHHLVPCAVRASTAFGSVDLDTSSNPATCDYGLEVADQAFYISGAVWHASEAELVVHGKGAKEAPVQIASSGSGTVLGSTTVYYDAEWTITITDPAVVPCVILASTPGSELSKDTGSKPADCEKPLLLEEARWYGDPGEILLEGTGVAGSTISFTGTALANPITSFVVDPSGLFSVRVPWTETHTVACDVTASANGVTATFAMRYPPFECDFGMNNAEFPFVMLDSDWISATSTLRVIGEGPREATVNVGNPATGSDYPSTTVYYDGTWTLEAQISGPVPCFVTATSGGVTLTGDYVDSKPGDCDMATSITEATWNPAYRRLTVEGMATKRTDVVISNAVTGETYGSDESSDVRKFDFEIELAEGVAEPCTVRATSVNGQQIDLAVAGASATCN